MIPGKATAVPFQDDSSSQSVEYVIMPTKTYRVDKENGRIIGSIQDKDAVFQFIKKVLDTDKYAFEIYDWYYGNELNKLSGREYEYIVTRIPKIINEALLVDDRIKNVRDFTFNKISIDLMVCSFYVDTIYGTIDYEVEVAI